MKCISNSHIKPLCHSWWCSFSLYLSSACTLESYLSLCAYSLQYRDYIQVTQRSLVVYHAISHLSLVFSQCTHKLLDEFVHQENTSDKWNIPWYSTKELYITILFHAIENTVANRISATYAQSTMGRSDVIPSNIQRLSCIPIFSMAWYKY